MIQQYFFAVVGFPVVLASGLAAIAIHAVLSGSSFGTSVKISVGEFLLFTGMVIVPVVYDRLLARTKPGWTIVGCDARFCRILCWSTYIAGFLASLLGLSLV